MGLTDSAAVYQRAILENLCGLVDIYVDIVDVYVDDILICGRTKAEHDSRLRSVIQDRKQEDSD